MACTPPVLVSKFELNITAQALATDYSSCLLIDAVIREHEFS